MPLPGNGIGSGAQKTTASDAGSAIENILSHRLYTDAGAGIHKLVRQASGWQAWRKLSCPQDLEITQVGWIIRS